MRCFECGSDADHMHHVVPKSLGGTMTVPLCVRCHGKCHGGRMTTPSLTRDAMAAKRRAGERVGTVPLGWSLDRDGVTLVPVEHELAIVERIRAARAAGRTMRAIAAELTADGIPTKRGNTVWSHATIQSVLLRKENGDV